MRLACSTICNATVTACAATAPNKGPVASPRVIERRDWNARCHHILNLALPAGSFGLPGSSLQQQGLRGAQSSTGYPGIGRSVRRGLPVCQRVAAGAHGFAFCFHSPPTFQAVAVTLDAPGHGYFASGALFPTATEPIALQQAPDGIGAGSGTMVFFCPLSSKEWLWFPS